MGVISTLRGHTIICKDGEWIYEDTGEYTAETYKQRPYGNCGEYETKERINSIVRVYLDYDEYIVGGNKVIKVYGNVGCSKCILVKKMLEAKGYVYTYLQGAETMKVAQETGMMELPILEHIGKFHCGSEALQYVKDI